MLVTCDPGKKTSWFAEFITGKLWSIHKIDMNNNQEIDAFFCALVTQRYTERDCLLCIEYPVFRGIANAAKMRQQDILDLAYAAGTVEGKFWKGFDEIQRVKPHEWKGQVDKKIMQHRILDRLDEEELEILAPYKNNRKSPVMLYNHNALDAVGIGLYILNRLGRDRIK